MGTQGKNVNSSNSMQRVKVYRLNDEGKWDDQGTGHVTIDYLERSEDHGLVVIDEEDNETILVHRISSDEIYKRQDDTIISWRDPECSLELALSFQESTGCSYIWDHICTVQRNMHFNTLGNLEVGPHPAIEALDATGASQSNDESFHIVNSELRELPSVELSTLPLILKTVVECRVTDQMRVAELIVQDQDFFPKLVELFRMYEDLENMDGLHLVFKLVKGIIMLNSSQIFDRIFSDEFILDIIGCLEYDPEVAQVQRHRSFLQEHIVFKEAIPIRDPLVLSKIHQTYRVGYIKDVILPRVLDEATISSLNGIIHANSATVVSLLKDDISFIQELFARTKSSSTSAESKKNLVLFLHEFCALSKSLPLVQQLRLLRDFASEGIFDIITEALESQDKKLVSTGTEILILFLNQDPNLLRSYIIQQEGHSLLGLLVKGMITDLGEDMHYQFLEILRILLDSYTLSGAQKEAIVEIFYENYLDKLIDVITSSCPLKSTSQGVPKPAVSSGKVSVQAANKPEILLNICELLCFCVLHHSYRIKSNFLMNNAIEKVMLLTHRKERFLVAASIRFMRAIISRNDEQLIRHIVRNNLLKPVVEAFVENGERYNLLHSGVLELLEYIRKENLKAVIVYLVDSFWAQLVKFEHFGTIHALKVKYEQSIENPDVKDSAKAVAQRKKVDERALEKEEEDYFNEDSDEEDSASARSTRTRNQRGQPSLVNGTSTGHSSLRSRSGGLVDYDDDDDDDEDYNPPPRKVDSSAEDDKIDLLHSKRKIALRNDRKIEVELTKKRKLDNDMYPGKVVAAENSSGNRKDSPNKAPLPPSPQQIATINGDSDGDNEKENACPRSCTSCLPETGDMRRSSSGEDCPLPQISSPSSEMVANSTNSEPYSVR